MAGTAIEQYLLAFNDALVAEAARRERILAEVEGHLRDSAASLVAAGATTEEAQREAVFRFGDPADAARRFGPDPLGRAAQLARVIEARRAAHPFAAAIVLVGPFIAWTLWSAGVSFTLLFWLTLLALQISSNLRARRATPPVAAGSRFARSARRAAPRARAVPSVVLGLGTILVLLFTTDWFLAIFVWYLACGAAAVWAQPSRCGDPSCRRCGARWVVRHAVIGFGVQYAAWALALAGPGIATIAAPDADLAFALFTATLFLAIAPLPGRRLPQRLRARRPAAQVALRVTPLLTLVAVVAAREPRYAVLPLVALAAAAYLAVLLEVDQSRSRSDATRRRLVERALGPGAGHAPG